MSADRSAALLLPRTIAIMSAKLCTDEGYLGDAGFTVGDKSNSDPACFDERLGVLAAALTSVRRGALMTTTVGAALFTAGTVTVF